MFIFWSFWIISRRPSHCSGYSGTGPRMCTWQRQEWGGFTLRTIFVFWSLCFEAGDPLIAPVTPVLARGASVCTGQREGWGRFTLRGRPRIILEGRMGVREGPQSFIDNTPVNTGALFWFLFWVVGNQYSVWYDQYQEFGVIWSVIRNSVFCILMDGCLWNLEYLEDYLVFKFKYKIAAFDVQHIDSI